MDNAAASPNTVPTRPPSAIGPLASLAYVDAAARAIIRPFGFTHNSKKPVMKPIGTAFRELVLFGARMRKIVHDSQSRYSEPPSRSQNCICGKESMTEPRPPAVEANKRSGPERNAGKQRHTAKEAELCAGGRCHGGGPTGSGGSNNGKSDERGK